MLGLLLVLFLVGMIAQWTVKGRVNKYSKIRLTSGLSGKEVAEKILNFQGLSGIKVVQSRGVLSDHYNPKKKELALSEPVYNQTTVSAAGVAAHEAGHAIQDATGYVPLKWRSSLVPTVQLGSWLGPIMIIAGLALETVVQGVNFGYLLAEAGIVVYALIAIFALITLPVEFDASKRAKKLLEKHGLVTSGEMKGVNSVLSAAAMTYVVAALTAIVEVARWAMILNQRSRD